MDERYPKVRKTLYTMVIKRMIDIIVSLVAIVILSPLFLVISVLELMFHGRPIIFKQQRPGMYGEVFNVYKFRSMNNKTDSDGKLLPGEERVTKFGRLIRRFSLDELPELFCILKGDMSIIGPRPLLVKYLPLYNERHRMRHEIRPGLTIVPLKPLKTWTWNDQFENDIWYVENCSFIIDLKMFFAVVKEAIVGSEYRIADTRPEFTGDNLFSDAKENV